MIQPPLQNAGPKRFLLTFVGGSLFIIMVCVIIASTWSTIAFVNKESKRTEVSYRQILQSFQVQYTSMAEEMWTQNLESIASRVGDIAEQLGTGTYELFLADRNGKCLYNSTGLSPSRNCSSPAQILSLAQSRLNPAGFKPQLKYEENIHRNIFLSPLFVGSILKGFLYVSLADPYEFYRGSPFEMGLHNFLPMMLVILVLWSLWLLASRKYILNPYIVEISGLERQQALTHMAQQVAHDLKSPLGTLLAVTHTLRNIPEEKRKILQGAVTSIREIANALLEKRTSGHAPKPSSSHEPAMPTEGHREPYVQPIAPLIQEILLEKGGQGGPQVNIQFKPKGEVLSLCASVDQTELKRVFSNLINNSIEAIENAGQIEINLRVTANEIAITITDNGCGIPKDLLPKLGQRGATFGKVTGSGLGLYHALATMHSWGGRLEVESREGNGTTVTIFLPKAETPKWVCSQITIPSDSEICILDDDLSIHAAWNERLRRLFKVNTPPKVKHFTDPSQLVKYFESGLQLNENPIILSDYSLGEGKMNGLEIIKQLKLEAISILVTGHTTERQIHQSCDRMGVQLLTKDFLNRIPILIQPLMNP